MSAIAANPEAAAQTQRQLLTHCRPPTMSSVQRQKMTLRREMYGPAAGRLAIAASALSPFLSRKPTLGVG
jgi:hypothetical protein